MIHRRNLLLAATSLAAGPRLAQAQTAGNAFVVSGFPPGGMGDMVARPLTEKLRGRYAESLVLDSRPGAGGRIAVEYVKRAAPDGKTILQIPGSIMSLYPHIYSKLPYDPVADFVPVSTLCGYVYSFTAGPGLPAEIKTVAEYIAWARANPKQALYGIPAAGSALQPGRRAGLAAAARRRDSSTTGASFSHLCFCGKRRSQPRSRSKALRWIA